MAAQQTTRQIGNETELKGLLDIIADQRKQLEMKQKYIEQLEFRLEQRTEVTKNLYQQRKAHFSDMQDRVYRIFLDYPKIAFCYEELIEEWKAKYPNVSPVNVPRRTRELAEQDLLWSAMDPESHKVYHYLRLEEMEENEGT
jgi:site-specific DNA-adenine methylase